MPSRDGHGQFCMVANKLKRSQSSQFSPLRDGGDVAKLQGKVTPVTGTLGADGKHKGGCNGVGFVRKASRGGRAGFLSWDHGAVRGAQAEAPGQKEFWILEQRFIPFVCTRPASAPVSRESFVSRVLYEL